jgi:hypothetical protein
LYFYVPFDYIGVNMGEPYSKSKPDSANYIGTSFTWDYPNPPTQTGQNIRTDNWSNVLLGSLNPYHKDQIRRVVGATTPCDGSYVKILQHPFVDHFQQLDWPFVYQHNFAFTGSPTSIIPSPVDQIPPLDTMSKVDNRATTQFLQKAKSELSSFESGQDIGELHQTIESIIHPMKSLREHVLSYFASVKKLKHKYKKVVSLKKAVADTYLEWTFGWNPLVMDISDGIVGLTRTRLPYATVEAHAKDYHSPFERTDQEVTSPTRFYGTTYVKCSYQSRLKGVVRVYHEKQPPSVQQELQLLPRDFLPTAWDLLPYSFVADYFANIGDIISAWSFPSSQLAWVNKTSRRVTSFTQVYFSDKGAWLTLPPDPAASRKDDFSSSNFSMEVVSFQRRSVDPSDLIPSFQISLPVSSKPWVNMAALLAGRSKPLTPLW